MLKKAKKLLSTLLLLAFIVSLMPAFPVQAQAGSTVNARIVVFSDPHYFPAEFISEGSALNDYLSHDRKLLVESKAILTSAVEAIKETDSQIVLVTGDLTKDGELQSHIEFAGYLKQLEDAGKKVFVIPGNHDINNPHAVKYAGDSTVPVEQVDPEKFADLYNDFGFEEAIARDSHSLSYVVEPIEGLRIIAMDSCSYDTNIEDNYPKTADGFTPERLDWVKEQLKEAKAQNKQVIGMMHHGLVQHFSMQKELFGEYVIDNWENISSEFADLGMKTVFTGHFHGQDIAKTQTKSNNTIYDIMTGSLVTYPCPYRTVELSEGKMNIKTKTIKNIDYDTSGVDFQKYADQFLTDGLNQLVPEMLAGVLIGQGMPQEQAIATANALADTALAPSYTIRNFLSDSMKAVYLGDEVIDEMKQNIISTLLSSSDTTTQMLGGVALSLLTDSPTADNNVSLNLLTGIDENFKSKLSLKLIGRYNGGGNTASEIVKYDAKTKKAFVVNGFKKSLDILDISSLDSNTQSVAQVTYENSVSVPNITSIVEEDSTFSIGDITSVAVHPTANYVAISIPEADKSKKGKVAIFDTDGNYKDSVTVGYLPDMLTFTPDGRMLLVANEGEPADDYEQDPEGSISIIDIPDLTVADAVYLGQDDVTDLKFNDTGIIDSNVIIKPGSSALTDIEPEYIAVSSDGNTAFVSLQENNAIAEIDLTNKQITKVHGLGFKDFSVSALDASKDDGINIRSWPVLGMYEPDGLEFFEKDGRRYILTPNEGDSREWGDYTNETTVKDAANNPGISLNADYYKNYTQEQLNAMASDDTFTEKSKMGKLKINREVGINPATGKYEALYAYGARSFSIWDADNNMAQVFDSGDKFEQITANLLPEYFNVSNDELEVDGRSTSKGPEPEDVKVGKIGSEYYAFVGLERIGGVMVYNITDPANAKFETYVSTRDFSADIAGDVAPEGLCFIKAEDSPTGGPVLLVANEVSGTVAMFAVNTVNEGETGPETDQTITIFHTNDTHGRVEEDTDEGIMGFAKISALVKNERQQSGDNVLLLDAGDTLHGQTIASISRGESIINLLNAMGYDAMAPGNHDFNYGKERLLELSKMAQFPIISANIVNQDQSSFLPPYTIKDVNGTKVGIFGLTTPETTYKTNPVNVQGLTFKDPVAAAKQMVNVLTGKDVDVIIALAHIGLDASSEITSEMIAQQVDGIDLIIDGHSHTALQNGKLVNNTWIAQTGEYDKSIGKVEIELKNHKINGIEPSLLPAAQVESIAGDPAVLSKIAEENAENDVITSVVIGNTEIKLEGERENARTRETNLGNLIADAMRNASGADIALTNGGGIRASIQPGEITKGEVITVLPFGNYVIVKKVTGVQLLAALENGLKAYPNTLGAFPQVSGMTVKFDPQKPAGSRVTKVLVGNETLVPEKEYTLATNDFIANGGDEYTMMLQCETLGEFSALDEILAEYISEFGTQGAKIEGRIRASSGETDTVNVMPDVPLDISILEGAEGIDLSTGATLNQAGDAVEAELPEIAITVGSTKLLIPAGTKVSGPADWNGVISSPVIKEQTSVSLSRKRISQVIEVGSRGSSLIFDKPVRLLLPGQAGKRVGFIQGSTLIEITKVLSEDSLAAAETGLVGNIKEGKINQGNDLVIWTKHFTEYVSYTNISSSSKSNSTTNGSSGSGSSGTGSSETTDTADEEVEDSDTEPVQNPNAESSKVTFTDIKGHWAKDAIEYMASQNIIKGINSTEFAPDREITRAEFAALAVRILKLGTSDYKGMFKDVEKGKWYAGDVEAAAKAGLISGFDGSFRPDAFITREEMAKIMVMAHKTALGETDAKASIEKFADRYQVSSWAVSYMETSVGLGLISGISENELAPKANLTRAEAAMVLYRLLNKIN